MAFHYRVRIAYKGTNYHGWQAQTSEPENETLPSVQGTLLAALRKIARYQPCTVSGTSRTDAGVHAQGQLGKLVLPRDIAPETLQRGLNSMVPPSIRIVACQRCAPEWNPKVAASRKEYHYYFSQSPTLSPLVADVVAHVPGPLDLARLEAAAELFLGEHDFYRFARRSTNAATTIRTIYECGLLATAREHLMEDVLVLRFVGNGFLKQMVRYMASALFAVARGDVPEHAITQHLRTQEDEKLCPKAPAHGLHLIAVSGI